MEVQGPLYVRKLYHFIALFCCYLDSLNKACFDGISWHLKCDDTPLFGYEAILDVFFSS